MNICEECVNSSNANGGFYCVAKGINIKDTDDTSTCIYFVNRRDVAFADTEDEDEEGIYDDKEDQFD